MHSCHRKIDFRHLDCHRPTLYHPVSTMPSHHTDMALHSLSSAANQSNAFYRRASNSMRKSICSSPHCQHRPTQWIVWPIPIDCWHGPHFYTAPARNNHRSNHRNDNVAWFRPKAMTTISMYSPHCHEDLLAIGMLWEYQCHDSHPLKHYWPNTM